MKTIIALLVLVGSSAAYANHFKGPYNTTDYNCYDLRAKINLNGQLTLGGVTYVGEYNNDCSGNEEKTTVFVKTADFKGCPLYTCVPKNTNW